MRISTQMLSRRWSVPLRRDCLLHLAQVDLQLVGDGLGLAEDLGVHRLLLLAALRIGGGRLGGSLRCELLETQPLHNE